MCSNLGTFGLIFLRIISVHAFNCFERWVEIKGHPASPIDLEMAAEGMRVCARSRPTDWSIYLHCASWRRKALDLNLTGCHQLEHGWMLSFLENIDCVAASDYLKNKILFQCNSGFRNSRFCVYVWQKKVIPAGRSSRYQLLHMWRLEGHQHQLSRYAASSGYQRWWRVH